MVVSPRVKNLLFVVQKHQASRLHYDLRLEKDGVLKSWAVPKEPPQEEGVKRLAVQVEDHPLEYADFAGEITEGLYGAGKVEIWDRGYYVPVKFAAQEVICELKGNRLKGPYCLIKLKPKQPQDRNWLFFKKKTRL